MVAENEINAIERSTSEILTLLSKNRDILPKNLFTSISTIFNILIYNLATSRRYSRYFPVCRAKSSRPLSRELKTCKHPRVQFVEAQDVPVDPRWHKAPLSPRLPRQRNFSHFATCAVNNRVARLVQGLSFSLSTSDPRPTPWTRQKLHRNPGVPEPTTRRGKLSLVLGCNSLRAKFPSLTSRTRTWGFDIYGNTTPGSISRDIPGEIGWPRWDWGALLILDRDNFGHRAEWNASWRVSGLLPPLLGFLVFFLFTDWLLGFDSPVVAEVELQYKVIRIQRIEGGGEHLRLHASKRFPSISSV